MNTAITLFKQFIMNLLKKKNPDEMLADSQKSGLSKTLTGIDLIILGISAIVGAGIFVMIGSAVVGTPEHVGAGPALIISIVLAGIICIFPAFCYAEFASMIPVSGSAYVYAYATMGELMAWMIGWVLMLEYAIGTIAVASSWTGYFIQFLQGFPFLPEIVKNPPVWLVNNYTSVVALGQQSNVPTFLGIPVAINLPAIAIVTIIALVLLKGMKESTNFAKIMVFIKIAVIAIFIIVGFFYIKPENWTPFVPNGIKGIELGIFTIFYAYIGFDAISTAAEETKNPQKDLPIGLIGSLLICSVIYILVTIVLTGMQPMSEIDITAPIAFAMRAVHQDWFAGAISIGALAGLTSVLIVLVFGTSRILYAMARDGFFPKIMSKVHPKYKTPYVITLVSTLLMIIGSCFINMVVAAELCILGTFTSFIIVCVGIIILRYTEPDRPRAFKVPFCPWFPLAGILLCGYVMSKAMPEIQTASAIFPIWLLVGVLIYFSYGYFNHRKLEKENCLVQEIKEEKTVSSDV